MNQPVGIMLHVMFSGLFGCLFKDTHPHKAGDASGYALLWEEMDRAF